MNRRNFFASLLGAAVGSCVRWLPMPSAIKWDVRLRCFIAREFDASH